MLKRSHANHELFCSGYLNVEEATVRGRLYDLPSGYPALVVPKENIQAMGTADPIRDASEQRRLIARECTVRTVNWSPASSSPLMTWKKGSWPWTVSRVLIPVNRASTGAC